MRQPRLHQRGKVLALALAAKTCDVTTGWAGAYDYAAMRAAFVLRR